MKKSEAIKLMGAIDACPAAEGYVRRSTPKKAWRKCDQPEWMRMLCRHLGIGVRGGTPKRIRKEVRWKTIKVATRAYLRGHAAS